MMNKKGDISINVVVIAILAVLVLVVLAIVFVGGVGNAVQKMREFFNIGTEGQTLVFVKEQCRILCDQAKLSNNPEDSTFCTKSFTVKEGNEDKQYSCTGDVQGSTSAGITCPGVTPCR